MTPLLSRKYPIQRVLSREFRVHQDELKVQGAIGITKPMCEMREKTV